MRNSSAGSSAPAQNPLPSRNNSAGMLRFASAAGGFGRVTWRQDLGVLTATIVAGLGGWSP
jgi:hypothetical protein